MKVMVAVISSKLLLGVRRAPPTNLRTIHEDDPRGETIDEALHLPPLRRTRPHDGTRQHKHVMEGKSAMVKIVAHRRGGHANIEGNGPDWQRPLVSPTQKNKSQKNHLNSRTYPAARASLLDRLNRAVQPRVHWPLQTLASRLHNRIKLHRGKAAHRLEQRRVMVRTNSGKIMASPNMSLGPTRTEEGNSPTRASTSDGRGRSDGGLGHGAGKVMNGGEGRARRALRL